MIESIIDQLTRKSTSLFSLENVFLLRKLSNSNNIQMERLQKHVFKTQIVNHITEELFAINRLTTHKLVYGLPSIPTN